MRDDCFVVGIGASAGSMDVLLEIFNSLPDQTGASFVIIRHLKRDMPSMFDDILQKRTSLKVEVAKDGQKVEADHVYLIPETHKLRIENRTLFLVERPEEEKINYSIDEFLTSLAEDVKEKAIAVILSGKLDDGSKGVQDITRYGGVSFVQDPNTASSEAMPREAIKQDHPYKILSPDDIAGELMTYLRSKDQVAQEDRSPR